MAARFFGNGSIGEVIDLVVIHRVVAAGNGAFVRRDPGSGEVVGGRQRVGLPPLDELIAHVGTDSEDSRPPNGFGRPSHALLRGRTAAT